MSLFSVLLRNLPWRAGRQAWPPAVASARTPQSGQQRRNQSTRVDWQHAVSAAEKLVGYPTSYLTLRSLLSDEMSNVATHLRKLVGTSHPLMETAKQMVYEGPQTLQTRGLLVLLVSKAAGRAEEAGPLMPQDVSAGLMHSQRSLAEITEMIHTAQLIHKGVVNLHHNGTELLQDHSGCSSSNPDFEFGNKIAILCGDYLLANACKALAALQNSQVVELVSSAISDFTEAEFMGLRDEWGRPLPDAHFGLDLWREKTFLSVGSLLAKSSKSALLLAGYRDSARLDLAYAFGRQVALAWRGRQELQPFLGSASPSSGVGGPALQVDVTSLPVVLHIQQLRQARDLDQFCAGFTEGQNQSGDKFLVEEVSSAGTGVTEGLQVVQEHCQEALRLLQVFPESEAREALQNIVQALQAN